MERGSRTLALSRARARKRGELLAHVHNTNSPYTLPAIGNKIASKANRDGVAELLYEMHDIARFPRVQDFASSCRLVTWARESAGKRSGTSGSTIGNAHLQWAFSEAAVFCLRENPATQQLLARFEKKHRKGKALTILAHTLARAVSYMLKRQTAFDLDTFLRGEGRGVSALKASPDSEGMHLILNARSGVNHCVFERP